jgi:hypothetical protein
VLDKGDEAEAGNGMSTLFASPKLIALMQRLSWPFRRRLTGIIENKSLVLDYLIVNNAIITGCKIYYGGGAAIIRGSKFDRCNFIFFGPAARTYVLSAHINGDDIKTFK